VLITITYRYGDAERLSVTVVINSAGATLSL